MRTTNPHPLKDLFRSTPRSALIIVAIIIVGIVVSVGVLAVRNNASQSNETTNVSTKDDSTTLIQKSPVTGSTTPAKEKKIDAEDDDTSKEDKKPEAPKSTAGTPKTPSAPSVTPQPQTPVVRADYNLNENWLFVNAGVRGVYNTCYPAPLTTENEVDCSDPTHPSTDVWFSGIGISKSADEAQNAATSSAEQKADTAHIAVKAGAASEAVALTESICTQYALSCGRW